jgi:hypothetical protein
MSSFSQATLDGRHNGSCLVYHVWLLCNALKLEARKLLERERLGASCGTSKNRNLRMNDSLNNSARFIVAVLSHAGYYSSVLIE